MDEQLRALLDEGQPILVEGRWIKFDGPVGCGMEATEEEVWYLSVDRVLEPNPLVRMAGDEGQTAVQPTAIAELIPSPTPEMSTPTSTIPPVDSAPTAPLDTVLPSPSSTVGAVITATSPVSATGTIGPTPSLVATAVSGGTATLPAGVTPSITVTAGASSTPAGATASATADATPGNSGIVDKGSLDFEDLVIASLVEGSAHNWSLDLSANSAITLTVAPASAANVTLTLVAPDGTIIVNGQDQAPAGEVETVTNQQIVNPGIYRMQIRTSEGTATEYAVMAMTNDSYGFVFRGTLRTNTPRSDTLRPDQDHFWFFSAEQGDSLSFSVTPQSASDPYIELYDPGGARILTIDNTGDGDTETLESYSLLESGMYGIRVAEFDFRTMPYQITLTSP